MAGERNAWTRMRLGDTVSIAHGWPFKSEAFTEETGGRPIVVSIGNFRYTGGFRFGSTAVKEYTDAYPKQYELLPGDILLVMTCQTPGGEILGIPGRIPDDGRTYLHNQRLGKVVVTKPDLIVSDFIFYLSLWLTFNRHLCATASGTKIVHTAPSRIEAFEFLAPPLFEQKRIAQILGTLDDKIELNHRIKATLEATSRAMFKSWFVDFDPVRQKAAGKQPVGMDTRTAALFPDSFEDSEIGEVPKGWRVAPLDEVADYLNGLALQKYPAGNGPTLPVIKIAQLRKGDATDADRCNDAVPAEYVIEDGDVLFSWSGSLEITIWCGGRGALNQHLFKVTSQSYPKWFYYLWTLHHLAEFRLIAADKATTMGHIQRKHLTAAKVVVPPTKCIEDMTRVMEPLLQQSIRTSKESRTLATLRDTLLPKLLSGEVRVPEAEAAVEEAIA